MQQVNSMAIEKFMIMTDFSPAEKNSYNKETAMERHMLTF